MRRFLSAVGVICTASVILFFPTTAHADAGADTAAFIAKINALRASKGVGSLSIDANLTDVATSWSAHMAAAGNISHNPSLAKQVTSNWQKLGENVGMGGDVDSLFNAFVNSPEHYRNLVDPTFTKVGVAVVWNGNTMYTTHDFMQLRGSPSPAPAPEAPRVTRSSAPVASPPAPPATPTEENPMDVPRAPERTIHSLDVLDDLLNH